MAWRKIVRMMPGWFRCGNQDLYMDEDVEFIEDPTDEMLRSTMPRERINKLRIMENKCSITRAKLEKQEEHCIKLGKDLKKLREQGKKTEATRVSNIVKQALQVKNKIATQLHQQQQMLTMMYNVQTDVETAKMTRESALNMKEATNQLKSANKGLQGDKGIEIVHRIADDFIEAQESAREMADTVNSALQNVGDNDMLDFDQDKEFEEFMSTLETEQLEQSDVELAERVSSKDVYEPPNSSNYKPPTAAQMEHAAKLMGMKNTRISESNVKVSQLAAEDVWG